MTLQEQFLVPDHRVRSIAGASFAGFYYVSLHKQSGTIYGLYYHRNSELYAYELYATFLTTFHSFLCLFTYFSL